MITCIIGRDASRGINSLVLNGHSGYAESGSDIICSAVSVLIFTAANALEDMCGYDTAKTFRINGEGTEELDVRLEVPETGDEDIRTRAQVILRTVELGLMSIASDYNDGKNRYLEIINKTTPEV